MKNDSHPPSVDSFKPYLLSTDRRLDTKTDIARSNWNHTGHRIYIHVGNLDIYLDLLKRFYINKIYKKIWY